jgi:hypothetical protein
VLKEGEEIAGKEGSVAERRDLHARTEGGAESR